MEYPKYLKLESTRFYVKLIDENNNLHIRQTIDGFAIDYNGSENNSYNSMVGCSRQEFDNLYIKIVEQLNENTKI